MRRIVLVAHDIRSTHNVGSLLRTAEGLGVEHVYFTGYTPYPTTEHDMRLPHISTKLTNAIHKTALGAEQLVDWSHQADVAALLADLHSQKFEIVALEQANAAIPLPHYQPTERVALLLGREVEGIDPVLLNLADTIVEIPMSGQKESFNVVQAAAMALYHCQHTAS